MRPSRCLLLKTNKQTIKQKTAYDETRAQLALNSNFTSSYFLNVFNHTSFIRLYADGTYFYPTTTYVVTVDRGYIQSIVFDKNCAGCSRAGDNCRDNSYNFLAQTAGNAGASMNCALLPSECGTGPTCNLEVFVTFQGTDINGKVLTSADARTSTFGAFDNFFDFLSFS